MTTPADRRAALLEGPATLVKGAAPALNGFKAFIMRGNVIDLAVAVVIGTAFTAVVTAIVGSIFTPLIAALFNADSLATALVLPLPGGSELLFGAVLAAVVNFLLIAFVVYFALVTPINKLRNAQDRRRQAGVPAAEAAAPTTELDLLTEIRDLLAANAAAAASAAAAAPTPPRID